MASDAWFAQENSMASQKLTVAPVIFTKGELYGISQLQNAAFAVQNPQSNLSRNAVTLSCSLKQKTRTPEAAQANSSTQQIKC